MNRWPGQNFCDYYSKVVEKTRSDAWVVRNGNYKSNKMKPQTRLQGLTSYREREHSINIWYFRAVRHVFNLLHRRGCWWGLQSGWRCTGLEVAGGCEESYCSNIDWKACIRIEKWRLFVIREKKKPGAHNNNNNYTQIHHQSLRYPACRLKKKYKKHGGKRLGCFSQKAVQYGTAYGSLWSVGSVWRKPFLPIVSMVC